MNSNNVSNDQNLFENNNNYYNADAYSGTYGGLKKHKKYSQIQMSMMTIALLVAGIGFLATGLIGFGFAELINQIMMGNQQAANIYNAFIVITAAAGIVSLVMYFIWIFRIQKASLAFQISVISIYCLSNGITFGGIFYFVDVPEIVLAFAGVGATLLITFFIAKLMSFKVAMGLSKFIMVLCFSYLILLLVFLLLSIFNVIPPLWNDYSGINNWIYFIIMGVSGLLSILFLSLSLFSIQRMDQFRDQLEPKAARNIAIYFGFIILMNLIRIFYLIISLISRFKSN